MACIGPKGSLPIYYNGTKPPVVYVLHGPRQSVVLTTKASWVTSPKFHLQGTNTVDGGRLLNIKWIKVIKCSWLPMTSLELGPMVNDAVLAHPVVHHVC